MPRGRPKKVQPVQEIAEMKSDDILVGAKLEQILTLTSYENKSITFNGDIAGYNYDNLLRNKQNNIYRFYELSDYFCDADPLYRGIIRQVLTPFSVSCGFKLKGVSEKVKQRYLDFYKATGFYDVMRSIFYELYKYSNVFIYFMPNGNLITLPQHRCRIADISVNGESVIEFNIKDLLKSSRSPLPKQEFVDETQDRASGYPEEVQQALKGTGSGEWVQLNPDNTFVLQETKETWLKYSVPMVAACLKAFQKKALIENYEKAQLNVGARSFLHVKIGEKDKMPKIDPKMITDTANIFKFALNNFPLAVTSWFIDSKFVSVDEQKNLFDKSKYNEVNAAILSAGGISSLIVSGQGDSGSSFAQAQISVQTAAERIRQNQDNFEEMMYKYNQKLAGILKATSNKIPIFEFNKVDLNSDSKFKEEAFKLYTQGIISKRTLSETYGFDLDQEFERRSAELEDIDKVMVPPINPNTLSSNSDNEGGRPKEDKSNRKSDESKSATGKQPKPSNPDGSE